MNDISIRQQYFKADCTASGVPRRGAAVVLTASSAEGQIRYTLTVAFFPHEDAEDFSITYDAAAETVLYEARGRRSKKREQILTESLQEHADRLAESLNGKIFWDQPLTPLRTA